MTKAHSLIKSTNDMEEKKRTGLLADLICLDSFEGPSGKYLVSACPVCISASSMIK